MKRFRFSLQSILELRQAEEQAAQREYACALRRSEDAARQAAMMEAGLRSIWEAWRGALPRNVGEFSQAHGWSCSLQTRLNELAAELTKAKSDERNVHARLVIAMQRREVMERVSGKQLREHERGLAAEEQQFLDEIAGRGALNR